jgi:hypothetical protein
MSTIATLNLPASTSGIWRAAPAAAPFPAQAADPPPLAAADAGAEAGGAAEPPGAAEAPPGAAEPPLGVPDVVQAAAIMSAATNSGNRRRRGATMGLLLDKVREGASDRWHRARGRVSVTGRTVPGRDGRPEG